MDKEKGNKPVKTFRAGGCKADIWKNSKEFEGDKRDFYNVTITRSYKAEDGWKETNSLQRDDIPKMMHVLSQSYAFIMDIKE